MVLIASLEVICSAVFYLCREVQKAVQTAKGLYQRWCELLEDSMHCSKEEYDWTMNELRNSLRSIEWDLEDLEETISILFQTESGPLHFTLIPSFSSPILLFTATFHGKMNIYMIPYNEVRNPD